MENQIEFFTRIPEGSSFKGFVDSLKAPDVTTSIIFYPSGIRFQRVDATSTHLVEAWLYAQKLQNYHYAFAQNMMIYEISVIDFRKAVNNIKKDSIVDLYKMFNEQYLRIRVTTIEENKETQYKQPIISEDAINLNVFTKILNEVPSFRNDVNTPNHMTKSKNFKDSCNKVCTDKLPIIVKGYNRGMILQSDTKGAVFPKTEQLGEINQNEHIISITTTKEIIKSLGKLNGLKGNFVRLCFESDKPIRIYSEIGSEPYGAIIHYIRSIPSSHI